MKNNVGQDRCRPPIKIKKYFAKMDGNLDRFTNIPAYPSKTLNKKIGRSSGVIARPNFKTDTWHNHSEVLGKFTNVFVPYGRGFIIG